MRPVALVSCGSDAGPARTVGAGCGARLASSASARARLPICQSSAQRCRVRDRPAGRTRGSGHARGSGSEPARHRPRALPTAHRPRARRRAERCGAIVRQPLPCPAAPQHSLGSSPFTRSPYTLDTDLPFRREASPVVRSELCPRRPTHHPHRRRRTPLTASALNPKAAQPLLETDWHILASALRAPARMRQLLSRGLGGLPAVCR